MDRRCGEETGSRSQTSRTYLEREFETFENSNLEDLIKHALKALSASMSADTELDSKSASIAIVGKDTPFEIIEGQPLQRYLDEIEIADDAMAADVVDENIDA